MSKYNKFPIDKQEFDEEVFEEVQHRNEVIDSYDFYECKFINCHFNESLFRNCKFIDCLFENSDLSLIKLTGATIRDCSFTRSKLVGINFCAANSIHFLTFQESILNYAVFLNLDLRHFKLLNCTVHEADFSECNMSKAKCNESDFAGSSFINSNLTNADFRGASNYQISSDICKLKKTKFSLPEALALLKGLDIILEDH
jgi:fluoroquinolone resistance protein